MAAGLMPTPERRRAPRVAERIPLAISDGGVALTAETKNISATGAYCTLDRFIAPMTKLQLQLELPDGARRTVIRCEGVVVRVEPAITDADHASYHVAIYFTSLRERDRAAIAQFVRRRLSAPSTSP